jgi:membrane associated rhomboid family serine protease
MKFLTHATIILFIFILTPVNAHRTYDAGLSEIFHHINNRRIAVQNRRSDERSHRETHLISQRKKKSTARFYNIPRQSQMRPNERGSSWSSRLLLVNVVVYVLQCFYPSLTKWGIKLSDKIMKGDDMYRLVSPMFLHGGIAHLMTNCYSLSAVGPDVERYFGSGRFLATYLISGIAGNYLSAIRSPNPSLGASGAVFGVVGAYFTFLIQNEEMFGRQGDYMQRNLAQTIMINLVMGAVSPMIDQWGHVGGFLGGIGMAATFGPRLRMVSLPFGETALIDEPLLRLPRHIESIPEHISDRFEKIKRRIQVNGYLADLPSKPWRNKRPQQFRRQTAPNRSIKPLPVN